MVDPLERRIELRIKGRSVAIGDFISDTHGVWVKSLDEEAQKTLAKFLLDNLLK